MIKLMYFIGGAVHLQEFNTKRGARVFERELRKQYPNLISDIIYDYEEDNND